MFEVTKLVDKTRVNYLLRQAWVHESGFDGDAPAITVAKLKQHEFVEVVADGVTACFAVYSPLNQFAWQWHGAVKPEFRKRYWRRIAHALQDYAFKNGIIKLAALCPSRNRACAAFNKYSGMQVEGYLSAAHVDNDGKLDDLILFGMTKEQWNARHGDCGSGLDGAWSNPST